MKRVDSNDWINLKVFGDDPLVVGDVVVYNWRKLSNKHKELAPFEELFSTYYGYNLVQLPAEVYEFTVTHIKKK